ncbi:MAG: FHA domain-containing protein [Deltaproteobacteria bacterium]|nr:FHA domain-containing protein [Deltaproteobacteria bacterium]
MATLRRLVDGVLIPLAARSLVGRSPTCAVRLDDRFVSSEHAKLQWSGGVWKIRDLGSRNGTFVDGQRVEPGTPRPLAIGARIGFGDEAAGFELADASAPSALATDLERGTVLSAVGEVLVLPDDERPELTVYPAPEGGWVVEDTEGEVRPVEDHAVVVAGGRSFRLDLPVLSEATPMLDVALTLANVTLGLAVSADEERVVTSVRLRGQEVARLEPREHAYLLVTLARARAEDHHLAPEERGWRDVERLLKMLRLDSNALNVSIHRARQQLANTGVEGAAGIIQTRRGQRRLGTDRFEVVRLEDG